MSPGAAAEPGAKGRILALDVGRVRIGVAVSDEERTVASPHSVLVRRGRARDFPSIAHLCEELGATLVVVGLPLSVDGTPTPMAGEIARFTRRLEAFLAGRARVVAWDEAMTTVEAEAMLGDRGIRGRKRRQVVDKVAAAVLLESYLNALAETGAPPDIQGEIFGDEA